MTEPLWGEHPHFQQFNLDLLFEAMLTNHGDAIDMIEARWNNPAEPTIAALREPSMTPPPDIPKGMVWLPDIMPRRALISLDEADPDGALRRAVLSLLREMPYRNIGEKWPYGTPSLSLRRCGATLSMPYQSGTITIYTEGREKTLAPDRPYWTNRASVFHNRKQIPASDLLAAGGVTEYVFQDLLDDPHIQTSHDIQPIPEKWTSAGMMGIELPLDAYVRKTEYHQ